MVPNSRFTELLTDIEPSPTTKKGAASAHTAVRDHLNGHESFKKRMKGEFLAGSYARDTAIRPVTLADEVERPDVDIIAVTNFTTADHPDDVLKELADALDDEFEVERINRRSVRVNTPTAEVDVVPVIASGTAYKLPDREIGDWKGTNPPGHITWSSSKNTEFQGRFKPLVKMLKWWKRENPTGKRPKGFVLEVLVSKHAPKDETHYGEAFAKTLENIKAAYKPLADIGLKPSIEDPSLPGSDIMSKVSLTSWKDFLERVRVHAGYAREAQGDVTMARATELWRRLFGPRFHSTDEPAKASTLATAAVAPAASGYAFPNAQVTPPNAPRGFA